VSSTVVRVLALHGCDQCRTEMYTGTLEIIYFCNVVLAFRLEGAGPCHSSGVLFFSWGETESTWYYSHCLAYSTSPGWEMMMSVEQSEECELVRETWSTRRKPAQCHFVHHKSHITWPGLAQAVSHRLPTAAARVGAQVRSCGIWGGQSVTLAGFLRLLRFPCQFSFHRLLHIKHHLSSGAGTIGQLVADVPSGLSLTPSQVTKLTKGAGTVNRKAYRYLRTCGLDEMPTAPSIEVKIKVRLSV
jgi:hypothetical protein